METLFYILNFIKDFLATPFILIGLFACIGLIIQKKPATDIIKGTLKTALGFIILVSGAGILSHSLTVFSQMFNHAFHLRGVIPNNEAIVAIAQKQFGTEIALVMLFGMIMNLILARITPFKYIFLTGHHTFYMSCLLTAILSVTHLNSVWIVVIASIILGCWMVLSPAMMQPFMRKVTKSDDIALGHFGSFGYLVAGSVGLIFKGHSRSIEDIKFPKFLMFLRDTSVAIALTMLILYIIVASFAGPGFIEHNLSNGQNFFIFILEQSFVFAAGVYIILAGVRLLISEITVAFKGIADKVVPRAKPALDCPVTFPFAPNAVVVGFISSFIGGIVAMFILPFCGLSVIVPGLVPHFFTGATSGVFGNATGGRKGCVLGAFANGIVISFLPALLLPLLGVLGFDNTTFGDADFGVLGIFFGGIIKLFQFVH